MKVHLRTNCYILFSKTRDISEIKIKDHSILIFQKEDWGLSHLKKIFLYTETTYKKKKKFCQENFIYILFFLFLAFVRIGYSSSNVWGQELLHERQP